MTSTPTTVALLCLAVLLGVTTCNALITEHMDHTPDQLNIPTAASIPKLTALDHLNSVHTWSASLNSPSLMSVGRTKAISTGCTTALVTLFQGFGGCGLVFGQVGSFFQAARLGVSQATQQTRIGAYCGSQCRTSALTNIAALRTACSPDEIEQYETASAQAHNSTDAFVLRRLIYAINLPCVQNAAQTEYCLPAFSAMVNLVATKAGAQYTNDELNPNSAEGVCRPCAPRFFIALTAFSEAAQVRQWRPIFLICLYDRPTSTYCVPEVQSTTALPSSTPAQIIAKYQAMCRTRCFQKWIIAAQVFQLGDFGNATARGVANRLLEQIDGVCLLNAAAEYCYPKWVALGQTLQTGAAAPNNCVYPTRDHSSTPACPASCKSYVQTKIVNDLGCCFPSWLWLRERYGDNPREVPSIEIVRFVNTTCDITLTGQCARAVHLAQVVLKLRNVAYAWVVAHRLQFWAAIRADVASYVGAAFDDVASDADASTQSTTTNPVFHSMSLSPMYRMDPKNPGMSLQAGTSATFTIGGDTDASTTNIQSTADSGTSDGSFDLTNTNQLPTEAYSDPSGGAGLEATGDSGDGARHAPVFSVFASAIAVTAYALF